MLELLEKYGIYAQTSGHKHCRPGWANMPCPFCKGNPGLHLGLHLSSGSFNCWRCGYHPTTSVVCTLLKVDKYSARSLINKYGGMNNKIAPEPEIRIKPFKYPSSTINMLPHHKDYLSKRNFDPDEIEAVWDLKSTSPTSRLDNAPYTHRILIPIFWNKKVVSFQARDVTGKNALKYKACIKAREEIHHKHILYGKQDKWSDTGICVEGVTDVWRFGEQSFCLFGIGYTNKQLLQIIKHFKRVFVIFDEDPQAIQKGKELTWDLKAFGVKAEQIIINGDPGSMDQDEANKLVKSLLHKN